MQSRGMNSVDSDSGWFRNHPQKDGETLVSYVTSEGHTDPARVAYYQNYTGYLQQSGRQGGLQNPNFMGFQTRPPDPRKVYERRREGLTKLRNVGIFNIGLAVITGAVGVAILIVASSNIGFPVFNFGVLLVGILHLVVGILCFLAGKNGLGAITETNLDIPNSIKYYTVAQFVLSVALITLATLAAVFAFLSGAICAGADITFRSRNNNEVKDLDVKQYCEPNNDANSALAFIGGSLCIIIAIMCIYGTTWICCYGTLFGWQRRGGSLAFARV